MGEQKQQVLNAHLGSGMVQSTAGAGKGRALQLEGAMAAQQHGRAGH